MTTEQTQQTAPEMPTLDQAIAEVFRRRREAVVLAKNIRTLYAEKAALCGELAESNGRIARALDVQIQNDESRLVADAGPYANLLKTHGVGIPGLKGQEATRDDFANREAEG